MNYRVNWGVASGWGKRRKRGESCTKEKGSGIISPVPKRKSCHAAQVNVSVGENSGAIGQPADRSLNVLDTAKHLAYQCLQEVRRAVQTMRQSDFDLSQALNELMAQLQRGRACQISVALELPPLSLQTSHQLYCVVQEGITNIQKHACASHVSLRGEFTADRVTLELIDNGNGFEPDRLHSGFGMRERMQMLGSQLKIESVPGQGTQISVTLPQ